MLFRSRVADFCGAKYAVAFNSGTSALHAAMFAAGVEAGDEVISSPLTFVASTNAAVYMGAQPVFIDIDMSTYCLDIGRLEEAITDRTRVIVAVDYAGFPVNMAAIREIAAKHNIVVVEDAAHALGARREGRMVGQEADMTMFSFHPVKHITTGEGGMIVCNDYEYWRRLKLFRSHGIEKDAANFIQEPDGPWYYEMQELGFNYRITDIQSALGLSQLRKLPAFIAERRNIAAVYDSAFQHHQMLSVPPRPVGDGEHAFHLYPLLFSPSLDRLKVFHALRAASIGVQVHYVPVHLHPFYRRQFGYGPGDFPNAEDVYAREISLPMYAGLSHTEQEYVIEKVLAIASAESMKK